MVGGGVSRSARRCSTRSRHRSTATSPTSWSRSRCVPAALGADSGVIGAAHWSRLRAQRRDVALVVSTRAAGRHRRCRATSPGPTPRRTPPRPGSGLVAVADPVAAKADALAGRLGRHGRRRRSTSCSRSGVDAISVCTPSPTHADLAVAALAAGRARAVREADRAARSPTPSASSRPAAAAAGLLMIGHVSRFEPDHAPGPAARRRRAARRAAPARRSRSPSPHRRGARATGWSTSTSRAGRSSTSRSTASTTSPGSTGAPPVRVTRARRRLAAGLATLRPRHRPLRQRGDGHGRDELGPSRRRTASSS